MVRWYVGMTTSTTAPASCYLGRRRWTRCRSCSTGCREMALLPLRDGELPLEGIVTQYRATHEIGRAPPRSAGCAVPRGPVSGPAALTSQPRAHVPPRSARRLFLCAACSGFKSLQHVLFEKSRQLARRVGGGSYGLWSIMHSIWIVSRSVMYEYMDFHRHATGRALMDLGPKILDRAHGLEA